MTKDKATALREAAEDVRNAGLDFMGIAPRDLLDLLAERERLRGALEKAERDLFTAHDWIAEDARDTARIRAVAEFHRAARQALEATDDQ